MEEMIEVQRQVLQNTWVPNLATSLLRISGWAKEEGGSGGLAFKLFQIGVEMW